MANDNKEVSVAYHELATLTNAFNKDNHIISVMAKRKESAYQKKILPMG